MILIRLLRFCGLLAALGMLSLSAQANESVAPARVVTLGGSVTEIVYALEMQHLLVGADQSSL